MRPKRKGPVRRFFNRLGFRANGGPVMAGGAYVVGERGPEIFQPAVSGRIQTVPGGLGRFAQITRAPGRGFAAVARAGKGFNLGGKAKAAGKAIGAAALAGVVSLAMDRAGVSSIVQAGILAGVGVALAALSQTFVAAGILAVAAWELLYAGSKWFNKRFPGVLPDLPTFNRTAAPASGG